MDEDMEFKKAKIQTQAALVQSPSSLPLLQ